MKTFLAVAFLIVLNSSYSFDNHFQSDRGINEVCKTVSNTGVNFGLKYSKSDKSKEETLCKLDFHSKAKQYTSKKGKTYAVTTCPKIKSTNPGLELVRIPKDTTYEAFTKKECSLKKRKGKKLAKYKVSTSCSYTPSILGYYHFSRLLNIGQVPVAVLRDLDRKYHQSKAKLAIKYTKKKQGWIYKNWVVLDKQLSSGKRNNYHPIRTKNGLKSYGALSENPKREKIYSSFSGSGNSGYLKSKHLIMASKSGSINNYIAKKFSNLPRIFALKDFTDMLVMDAILSQFDRYGNVHYYKYYYYKKGNSLKREKVKKKKKFEAQKKKMEAKGAILATRMLLKDNDCGVKFRNRVLDDKALLKIRHLSKETYAKVQKLNELFKDNSFTSWLKKDLQFTSKDVSKIKSNTSIVYNILKKAVKSGKLRLDLNPNEY